MLSVGAESHSRPFIGVHYWNHYWQASRRETSKKQPKKQNKKQMLKMETCLARCHNTALCNDDNIAAWLHNLIYTNIKRGKEKSDFFSLSSRMFVFFSPHVLKYITVSEQCHRQGGTQVRDLPVRMVAFSR